MTSRNRDSLHLLQCICSHLRTCETVIKFEISRSYVQYLSHLLLQRSLYKVPHIVLSSLKMAFWLCALKTLTAELHQDKKGTAIWRIGKSL